MRKFYKILFLFVLVNFSCVLSARNNSHDANVVVPTATITTNASSVCIGAANPIITFTGKDGTAPYTFTYKIGTGADINIFSTGNIATVNVPTTTSGVYIYTLVSVKDSSGTQLQSDSVTVSVNAPPVVDFTIPNNNNATPNCSSTAIQFNATQIQSGTIYSYAWDFGDGTSISTTSTSTTSHTFEIFGIGNQSFNVGLTVTNTVTGCVSTSSKTVIVKKSPDARLDTNSTDGATPFVSSKNLFINCSATIASPNFIFKAVNASTTIATNTSYSIDWGDLSPVENFVTFTSATHNYTALGFFNITITATNSSTLCTKTKTYRFFNGNSPIGNLDSPGNANSCVPYSYTWNVDPGTFNNPPGTSYVFSVNDGSTDQTFTQETLPTSITHQFNKSSCGLGLTGNKFTVTFEITNPCDSNAPTTLVSSTQKPIADFTISPTNAANAYCVNNAISLTNTSKGYYGTSCETNYNKTWIITPSTGWAINSGTLTSENIGITFNVAGNYSIKLAILQPGGSSTNTCTNDEITKTICIEALLTPAFTLGYTGNCTPLYVKTTNTTNITGFCTTPTYQWAVTYSPTNCGTTSNYTLLNGTTLTSFAPEFNFINPGTYSITLTTNNSCGSIASPPQTVIVKQPPTVTINPIANICQTGNSTSINPTAIVPTCSNATYAWSFPGGTPATSPLAVPGAISYAIAGNHIVSLSVTNECGTTIATDRTFTINTLPTLTGDLFSCVSFTSQLTGSATAASISPWTSSNTTIATVSSTGLVTAVSGGTTTITYTNANNCKATEVFTVNPAPTITPLVSSTVCMGGTPTVLSFTISGATGTPTYQWYSNTINNTTTGTVIPGEINTTFNPPASVTGTFYYYCIITLPTGGCSNIKTNTATVTIMPNASITSQPTPTQNLCVGVTIPSALSISYSGGTGTVGYQWYSNATNLNTGGSPIAGATSAAYSPPVFTSPGNYYYYGTVSLNGNGCLPATSNVAEVVVFADPTISTQPTASQTLCQGATPLNLDVTATGGNGTFSYQWYSNSTNTNTGGTLISGATINSYTPPTITVGTNYYYCIVSQNSTSGCSVTSATAAIIVISAPTITQPASSTVCQGGNPTPLSITVIGATGTPTYQWYSNTANNTTTGTAIPTETNPTYTPSALTVGTTYYYCIITLPSGGCSSITSNIATVTINAGATIDTQPTLTQSLCVGATITTPLTISYTGGSGGVSYQWYSNTTNSNTGGTLIPSATNASYTPAVFTTSGTNYYYATLSFSGNGCGPITSNPAEIMVVTDPTVSSQPLVSQTLCQGASPTNLTVSATGGIGTYSYQWFSSVSNSNTGGILITGETNASYTPPTTSIGTRYYYCVITQTGIGCNANSATAEVIVNLAPTITIQPQSSTVCLGITPTVLSVTYNNGVGTPAYQWYSNTVNTIMGGTPISGATNATYNPQNTVVGITYYYCIITLPSGGCSSLTSNIASVTINPNPVISNKTDIICSGNSFSITPDNLSGDVVPDGTTYTWSNPTISPAGSITGASAQNIQQNTISQTLINTTTSPAIVTYTVTPLSGFCTGANFTIEVTVNPAISPNVTSTNSSCFGANTGAIQTNITGGIPFSSGAAYLISWTGPNGFSSSQPSISNLAFGDYILSITDQGGCPINEKYTITEPNDIIITTDLEKDITCFNAANGEIKITLSGGTLNYTIAWTKNGLPYAVTEDLSDLSPGTYIVTVSDANNCGPETATFTITEPSILAVSLGNKTNILCFGQSTGTIDVNIVGGTLPYTYAWTGPNGFGSSNQNLTNLFAGTYDLIVTDNSGCAKNLSAQVTQTPEINIQATTTPIVCYGDNNASINLVVSGGISPYQISWSNLATGTFQDNLSAGDYIITVTDALNCTKTLTVNIPEAPIFTVNPVVKNISCFGAKNGSINLNFIGGIAPIKLTWSDSSVAGTTRNNLGPGQYTVTIIDSKPCTIVRSFTILEPQALVLSANTTNAFDCDNANSGAINLLVSGGSTPFTYAWSNGATTEDLINISAGNYLVTVTDANGCSKQTQYSINRPPPIVTGVVTQTDFDCETKYVKQTFVADVSGGVPPYQLAWSSGAVSGANNEMMNTDQNGTVILNVTDAIGCKSNYTFNVAVPTLGTPSFNASSSIYSTFGTYSINDPIQFTNTATGDYVGVAWDFGDGGFSTETNPVHTFINPKEYVVTQTVTYPFGCIYVQKITFIVGKGYVLVVPNAFTPNNDSVNDTFRPVTKGLKNVHLDVYDTWGSLIYSETGEVLRGWDGKLKGINAENGNYYCKVSGATFYGTIVNENHPFVLIK
jgi:gliding motility-associated-like protein